MTTAPLKSRWKIVTGEFFSARYLFVRALAIVALFLVAHLAGLREYTTFLSGTTANTQVSFQTSAFYGMIYIALYLGAVVIAPMLVIAAGLLLLWNRRTAKTSNKSP
jgi:hypothetical protein